MSYSVLKKYKEYVIKEKDTNHVVFTTDDEREARKMCRSLNLGSGFNGFTPYFMTITYLQNKKKGNQ